MALGSAGWALAEGRRGGTAPGGRTRPVEKAYAAPEGPALKCPLYYLYAVHCNLSLVGCDHGTHVAGIAAGQTSPVGFDGVARGANIIAVQVFSRLHDSTGNTPCANAERSSPCALSFTSDQMQALEYVYNLRNTLNIAAVNMSLGGGKHTSACDSDALKPIIDNLPAAGIATVIAAGNKGYTSNSR